MKRWPLVMSPAEIPSIDSGTTSLPVSSLRIHRMECKGRTHLKLPVPQRIDLGQGKFRTVFSNASATISAAGRPGLVIFAKRTVPFGVSRSSRSFLVRPAPRRNPSMAFSGASARGPLRSSTVVGLSVNSPSTVSARRRGVEKPAADEYVKPASTIASVISFFKSSAARRCIRAGISSEKSSIRRSGIWRL